MDAITIFMGEIEKVAGPKGKRGQGIDKGRRAFLAEVAEFAGKPVTAPKATWVEAAAEKEPKVKPLKLGKAFKADVTRALKEFVEKLPKAEPPKAEAPKVAAPKAELSARDAKRIAETAEQQRLAAIAQHQKETARRVEPVKPAPSTPAPTTSAPAAAAKGKLPTWAKVGLVGLPTTGALAGGAWLLHRALKHHADRYRQLMKSEAPAEA